MNRKEVSVSDLKPGMYVCELDRPWLGTPFLMQGFCVETPEQIEELRRCCAFVYVDTERTPHDVAIRMSASPRETAAAAEPEPRPISIPRQTTYEDRTTVEEELQAAKDVGSAFVSLLTSVQDDIRKHTVLDVQSIKGAVLDMVESVIRNPSAMQLLTTLQEKDPHSIAYTMKVTITLVAFGRHLGCPPDVLEHLGLGGLMLDIGKLRLPDHLLAKKAPLTGEEHRMMKFHVALGVDLLKNTPGIPGDIVEMVATHHEREDGSGYPRGLGGDEISLLGKIAGIVDYFEELTTERAYSPAATPQQAVELLHHGRVRLFEAWLVDRFIEFTGLYPVGTVVELNTGEVALVLATKAASRSITTLMLILDANKNPYPRRSVINLGVPAGDAPLREITRSLEPRQYGINPGALLPTD
ncbi:MAG TPA: HD domain-containing phosphohydrolase [Burkholderiales bacterium]